MTDSTISSTPRNSSVSTGELASMINELTPIMRKVQTKYQPRRKFLVISDNSFISGILSLFAVTNDWILLQENPIGLTNLEDMEPKEKTECWGKRIGAAIKRHKIFQSNITLSPDKAIDCNKF